MNSNTTSIRSLNNRQESQVAITNQVSCSSQALPSQKKSYFFRGRRWSDITDDDSSMSLTKSSSKVVSSLNNDPGMSNSSRWRFTSLFRRDGESQKGRNVEPQKVTKMASTTSSTHEQVDASQPSQGPKADQDSSTISTTQFPEGFVSLMHFVSLGEDVSSSLQPTMEKTQTTCSTYSACEVVPSKSLKDHQQTDSNPTEETLPTRPLVSQESVSEILQPTSKHCDLHNACANQVTPIKRISPARLVLLGLPILQAQREYSALSLSRSYQRRRSSPRSFSTFDGIDFSEPSVNTKQWDLRGSSTTFWSMRRPKSYSNCQVGSKIRPQLECHESGAQLPLCQREPPHSSSLCRKDASSDKVVTYHVPITTNSVSMQYSPCADLNSLHRCQSSNERKRQLQGCNVVLSKSISHRISRSSVSKIRFGLFENSASFVKDDQSTPDSVSFTPKEQQGILGTQDGLHGSSGPERNADALLACGGAESSYPPVVDSSGKKNQIASVNSDATCHIRHLLGIDIQQNSRQHQHPPINSKTIFQDNSDHLCHEDAFLLRNAPSYPLQVFLPHRKRRYLDCGSQSRMKKETKQQHRSTLIRNRGPWPHLNRMEQQRAKRNEFRRRVDNEAPLGTVLQKTFYSKGPTNKRATLPISENVKQYRMRQIAIGKSTTDYRLYILKCPKSQRCREDPVTPRVDMLIDCGGFNNETLLWKRAIGRKVEELKNSVGEKIPHDFCPVVM